MRTRTVGGWDCTGFLWEVCLRVHVCARMLSPLRTVTPSRSVLCLLTQGQEYLDFGYRAGFVAEEEQRWIFGIGIVKHIFFPTFEDFFLRWEKGKPTRNRRTSSCFYSNIIPNILSGHPSQEKLFLKGKHQLKQTMPLGELPQTIRSPGGTTLWVEIPICPFL